MTGAYGVAALPLTREEAGMAAGAQQTPAAESSGHFGLRTLPSLTKAAGGSPTSPRAARPRRARITRLRGARSAKGAAAVRQMASAAELLRVARSESVSAEARESLTSIAVVPVTCEAAVAVLRSRGRPRLRRWSPPPRARPARSGRRAPARPPSAGGTQARPSRRAPPRCFPSDRT